MPGPDSPRLADEASRWVAEGIVTGEQAGAIVARYPRGVTLDLAGFDTARPSIGGRGAWVSPLLHTAAGLLIGAAVLAFVYVGLEARDPGVWSVGLGLGLGVGGVLLITLTKRPLVGEALLVAMMTAVTAGAVAGELELASWIAIGVAAGSLVWRHDNEFLQSVAVVAVTVAGAMLFFDIFDEGNQIGWLLLQVALLAVVLVTDRVLRIEPGVAPAAFAVAAFAFTFVMFLGDYGDGFDSVTIELLLGLTMAALAGAGIGLGHRGLVSGAVIVLGVDAIVFAFDVGNVLTGILALLGLAGILLWQAGRLRSYLAR